MKKTLLAVVIPALVSLSANAAVVYDKDGTKAEVYGRAQVQILNDDAAGSSDTTLENYGRLGIRGAVAINDQWTGFGRGEWQIDSENSDFSGEDKALKTRHFYAGFDGGELGKFTFGQTDTAYYDAVAATDIFNEWGSSANGYKGRQEGQAIYSASWGGFHGGASYQFSDDTKNLDYGYAANLGYSFDFGLSVAAGLAKDQFDAAGVTSDKDDWAASVAWGTFGEPGVYAAALYNESKDASVKAKYVELAAAYTTDTDWTFLGGFNKQVEGAPDAANYYLLGAQYNFTANFLTYAEYKFDQATGQNDAWTLALQYNF